jgi:hypothetical protein
MYTAEDFLAPTSWPGAQGGRHPEYRTKTEAFSRSVRELQELRGTSPLAEYQRVQRLSEEARIKSEQARLALEEHINKHHC